MTGIAGLALPSLLARAMGALGGGAIAAAARNPWPFVAGGAALFGAWEMHEADTARHALAACRQRNAQIEAASQQALTQAFARNAALTRQSKDNADAADLYHAALDRDRGALGLYIRAHGLRAQPDPAGSLPAAAGDDGAAFPANASAGAPLAEVTTDAATLQTCDDDYAYAQAAWRWAQGLNEGAKP